MNSSVIEMMDLVNENPSVSNTVSSQTSIVDEKGVDPKTGRPRRSYEKRKFYGFESDCEETQKHKVSKVNRSKNKKPKGATSPKKSARNSGVSNGTSITDAKKMRKRRKKEQERAAREKEEEEKKRAKFSNISEGKGNIICAADGSAVDRETEADESEFFWEIETIVGKRKRKGVEYLVRWKGCPESDNTWEPRANLCDTALEEALKYDRRQRELESKRLEDENKLFAQDETELTNENNGFNQDQFEQKPQNSNEVQEKEEIVDYSALENVAEMDEIEKQWQWTDIEQVKFREIDRVDVNDPLAKGIIHDARVNGVPIVLTGHTGWPNFMKRWLVKREKSPATDTSASSESNKKDIDDIHPEIKNTKPLNELAKEVEARVVGNSAQSKLNGNIMDLNDPKTDDLTAQIKVVKEEIPLPGGECAQPKAIQNGKDTNHSGRDSSTHRVDSSNKYETENELKKKYTTINNQPNEDSLNLAHPSFSWELDIQKMINDIGNEDVPIVRRNYKETNPIHGNILASKFLKTCWLNEDKIKATSTKAVNIDVSTNGNKSTPSTQANPPKLYLHQWQFPLSDTAGRKLCHQTDPLPNDIFGEDLLKYWIDLPQCRSDNPLQYIFMGKEGTMSKLHKDNGGLAITIAPIVGEKECVLVHRADGSNCLYHLAANIEKEDSIDLHRYPLVGQARIWKSIVKPGEILLMPHGTYHQCRNITPCLSYSRFHLDTINLMPFLQSMIDGDAPELEHDEILWNASAELIKKIDKVVDDTQCRIKSGKKNIPRLSDDIVRSVNTLRTLRHFIREICRRLSVRKIVKGNLKHGEVNEERKKANRGGIVQSGERICMEENTNKNGQSNSSNFSKKTSAKTAQSKSDNNSHDWDMLVDDIDLCLHEFRFRRLEKIPTFRKRKVKVIPNALNSFSGKQVNGDEASAPVVAYETALELAYLSLPKVSTKYNRRLGEKVLIDEVEIGDNIVIKFGEKFTKTKVLDVVDKLPCAYVSFEDYPSLYDELLPYHMLRLPNAGGINSEVPNDQMRPGLVVIALLGEKRQEYRGVVQYITCQKMARIYTKFSPHSLIDRWISDDFILDIASEENRQEETKKIGRLSTRDQWKLRAELQVKGDKV